jgi:hypothetical protein
MMLDYRALRQVACLLSVVIGISSVAMSAANAADVADIIKQAMLSASAIQSYEFTAAETTHGFPGRTEPVIKKCAFYQSGDMYRTEMRWGVKNNVGDSITAFDGVRSQQWWEQEGSLTFPKDRYAANPYVTWNPMVIPYLWMLKHGYNWSDLKSPDLWSRKAAEARLVGSERVRGLECDTITLPYEFQSGESITVYLATALNNYPIRFTIEDKSAMVRCEIDTLEHLIVKTEGIDAVVPVAVRLKTIRPQELVLDFKLAPASIKINHPIPEQLFKLAPSFTIEAGD